MIHGRSCMSSDELDLLERTVAVSGDHCEIGSLWGGTAIVAASAKEQAGVAGMVLCIDPFTDTDAGWENNPRPSADVFWQNIDDAGFRDRVELYVGVSAPWPFPMSHRFSTVLIDGNHNAPWPETDWESARCVTDTILVHDVNWHEAAVAGLHARVESEGEWNVRESAKFLYVYDRAS